MYEGLRLTELHEEIAFASEQANRHAAARRPDQARLWREKRGEVDAEIRARVAAQPVGRLEDPGFPYTRDGKKTLVFELFPDPAAICAFGPLVFGVPDAERVYPAKRRGIPSPLKIRNMVGEMVPVSELESFFREWTHHAQHAVPVEGCHLCREGRR